MLQYKTHVDNGSMFNTPPTYAIYILGLVLEWIKGKGGLAAMKEYNATSVCPFVFGRVLNFVPYIVLFSHM